MRRTVTWISMVLVVVLSTVYTWGAAEVAEKKVKVKASELPTAIKSAIKEAFPRGKILAIEKEVEGEDPGQYDVEVQSEGKTYEVEISPEGVVVEAKEVGSAGEDSKGEESADEEMKWTDDFQVQKRQFATTGKNRFFILQPGYQLTIESKSEKVILTVLDETKKIGNVVTRILEEREFEDGELIEVSRNFFAVCKTTGDVFYFGEEVDDYKDGKVVGHGGAWRADEKGCKAGIIMPGTVLLGARHYQEIAPNAMDRAEIIADNVTMKTPAGTFKGCVRVRETSPLEPGDICYKTYAPGIGLIQDEGLLLTGYSKSDKKGADAKRRATVTNRKAKKQADKEDVAETEEGDEETLTLKELPQRVRHTVRKQARSGKITEIEKKRTDDGLVYEVEITENGEQRDILISAKGKYLGMESDDDDEDQDKAGAMSADDDDENDDDNEDEGDDDEEEEETLTLKELPKVVRQTARKQAGSGEITEIEKKQTDDGVVYEIEITENGKQRDILISAEGKYLGMEADDDDEGDDEDEDEDDR